MNSNTVILSSIVLYALLVRLIVVFSNLKSASPYREYRIVVVGASFFMYISWLVIYMAHVKPFIAPIFRAETGHQKHN